MSHIARPVLCETRRALRLEPNTLLSQDVFDQAGEDVVIGIVDFGCDFKHRNFRRRDATTRLLSLWKQGTANRPNRFYSYQELNRVINMTYRSVKQRLRYDTPYQSHGTHVMDIAAGSGASPGIASKADIVFVDTTGHIAQICEAVRYIFDQADNRPCVVNLSLQSFRGPHDGSGLMEQFLDTIVQMA